MQCGLDRLKEYDALFRHKRLGLVTTPSSVDASLVSALEVLCSCYQVVSLFGAEHGVRGAHEAGHHMESTFDEATGLPVFSLYRKDSQHLTGEMVQDVDAMVFDIQDLGLRFYTYVATLKNLLEDCACFSKQLIVLDRPNPLGGNIVEGNLLKSDSFSFVGPSSLPIRYGLTIGELALYLNEVENIGCDLEVVPLSHWSRDAYFDQLGRPFLMTSPAIGHFSTVLAYAGMCLLEGTNISEGRGTSAPFELFGAPFIESQTLCRQANGLGLDGVAFTPTYFSPTTGKFANQMCSGLFLHILDRARYRPVECALRVINLMHRTYPEQFAFLPFFDHLAGVGTKDLLLGDIDQLVTSWNQESIKFATESRRFHLYA